jgi:DNA-binding response OmpR family regulator
MSQQASYRALVIDDDVLIRTATGRALGLEGFKCELAANGRQALEKLGERRFDLVVTDLMMPDIHGHKVVVELLAMSPRPAIVVLTGMGELKLLKDLMARGVDDIFFKPVNYDVVVLKSKMLVQRRLSEEASPGDGVAGNATLPSFSKDDSASRQVAPTAAVPSPPQTQPPSLAAPASSSAERNKSESQAQQLVSSVSTVRDALPQPPSTYDGFRVASSNQFGIDELKSAIQLHPVAACEALLLANRLMFQAAEQLDTLKRAAPGSCDALLKRWQLGAMFTGTFAAGLVLGCLSWWLAG